MTEETKHESAARKALFRGKNHAELYAKYRPTYPDALYNYLVSRANPCRVALDCATGNGQAAVALADRVDRVVATDISEDQLARAKAHPRVEYRLAPAEQTGLPENSVDLVTVATGIHWFDFDSFYEHINKVVRDGGIIGAWCYWTIQVDEEIDGIVRRLKNDILVSNWNPRIEHPKNQYQNLPFPFEEFETPSFETRMEWTLEPFTGFISTWSAVQSHLEATGEDPIDEIRKDLQAAWGPPTQSRTVCLPLATRIGRVE